MIELINTLLFDYTIRTVAMGAAVLGIVAGALGTFALLRRQSLLGDAMAHAALPGVVVGYLVSGERSTGAILAGAERPIDDVTKRGSRSGNDHDVASSAIEKIFNSFQFVLRQLFTEPHHPWPEKRVAVWTARDILIFL